jgi:hypothetical protein
MQNYLSGYLSVLPLIQRKRIIELLSKNKDYKYGVVSNSEFNALMEQITNNHRQTSEYIAQNEQLDSSRYNEYFGKVYTDLYFMFNEINLIDRAASNYHSLASAELSNLGKEVVDLNVQVENFKLVASGEDGLVVRTENFYDSIFEEDPEGVYADLFCDRDGTTLPRASIILNNKKKVLSLSTKAVIDKVHNDSGLLNVSIQLLDQRGQGCDITDNDINKALDGSDATYWLQIIDADDEINMQMYGVPGPGAMGKLAVTFNSPTMISEISLTPFGIYPLEIAAILYEKEIEYGVNSDIVPPTQKYIMAAPEVLKLNPDIHPLINADKYVDSDTMVYSFPNTLVKRLIFVVKQKNHEVKNKFASAWDIEKYNLWSGISSDITDDERFKLYLESAEGGFDLYVQ